MSRVIMSDHVDLPVGEPLRVIPIQRLVQGDNTHAVNDEPVTHDVHSCQVIGQGATTGRVSCAHLKKTVSRLQYYLCVDKNDDYAYSSDRQSKYLRFISELFFFH